jgi:4-amino-4-deoxychorismate lyase
MRLGLQPALAGLKHLNRLEQVMARAEWADPRIDEGIMQSLDGRVIECVAANLFLVRDSTVITPRIRDCGVDGVTRRQVLATAASLELATEERDIAPDGVINADEIFVTSSTRGIAAVGHVEDVPYPAPGPVTDRLIQHSDWLT